MSGKQVESRGGLIIGLLIAMILAMIALVKGPYDQPSEPLPSPSTRMMLQPGVKGTLYEVISSGGSERVCAGGEDDLPESLEIIVLGPCN